VLGKLYAGQQGCSIAGALEVVGDRWTLLILRDALLGVRRFNDFQLHLDVPRAVLAERLGRLVEDGIFQTEPDPQHAGRRLYRLTAAGEELWPVLYALLTWGERHRRPNNLTYHHAACGTRLDAHATCPTCNVTPSPREVVAKPRRGAHERRHDPVGLALRKPRRLLQPIETKDAVRAR
jgi:DNA-binding HxlR family transcriptional regulator